jgi:hypothetical protein
MIRYSTSLIHSKSPVLTHLEQSQGECRKSPFHSFKFAKFGETILKTELILETVILENCDTETVIL